jgi:prevent-host-death family protein
MGTDDEYYDNRSMPRARLLCTMTSSHVYTTTSDDDLRESRGGWMKVGIRELRADLRTWLDRAAGGEEVVITERGAPVAKLVTIAGGAVLDRLIAAGAVTPAERPAPRLGRKKRLQALGNVSDLVRAQRR